MWKVYISHTLNENCRFYVGFLLHAIPGMYRIYINTIRMWGTFHWLSAYILNMFLQCQEWAQGITFKQSLKVWTVSTHLPVGDQASLYNLPKSVPDPFFGRVKVFFFQKLAL